MRRRVSIVALWICGCALLSAGCDGTADESDASATSAREVPQAARAEQVSETERQERFSALVAAWDAAVSIEDPLQCVDAMMRVQADMEVFLEEVSGLPVAIDLRSKILENCDAIDDAFGTAMERSPDPQAAAQLRASGVRFFTKYEEVLKRRIAVLKAIDPKTPEVESQLQGAWYHYPRTLYRHALLFPGGSAERKDLCERAIDEYAEFDLDYSGEFLNYYALSDTGLCYRELGKFKEALASFDATVEVREVYGDPESGVWPIPPDIVDLLCYAMLQKSLLYADEKQPAKVAEVGKDYFTSTPEPFAASSSMVLAWTYADALHATGDQSGHYEIGRRMIDADPEGLGGVWGRKLLDR